MRETHFIDKDPNIYEALAELQKRNVQSMNEEQILSIIEDFFISDFDHSIHVAKCVHF